MPKTIPPLMAATLQQKQGLEPVIIIEVQWVENGQFLGYADKGVPDEGVRDNVLEIETLESVVKLDQSGQSQSISVILSDVDGELKTIIDNHNIHGRPVNVYQWVYGLPLAEKFLLYQGEINGPVQWNSGDRTLRFEVVTQLANREVGFSPEQGEFVYLPQELVGKPWPMVFGSVQNIPVPPLVPIPKATLLEPVGVVDPSLINERLDASELQESYRSAQVAYAIALGQVEFQIDFEGRSDLIGLRDQLQSAVDQLGQLIGQLEEYIRDLTLELLAQQSQVKDTFEVNDATGFPQNVPITVRLEDVIVTGQFVDNIFYISSRTPIGYSSAIEYTQPFGFKYASSGTDVKIYTDFKIRYIVSLTPGDILFIRAYKNVNGYRSLVAVPPSLWSQETVDMGPFTVTVVTLDQPLSSIPDAAWEDDLYVTFTGSIGPNTVDIIEWLVDTFTDLDIDTTSFADTKVKIDNYPSHFALLEQWNILELLETILFQARCAGWIANNTVYLKYLSLEEDESETFEDSDVVAGTMELLSTPTEDLVTKFVAEWTDDLAKEEKNKVILRSNVNIYGLREKTYDFFIYNIEELVIKSATFWTIRLSNIWKRARFQSHLNKLSVNTFDTVQLDMTGNFYATGGVKGLVTESIYDTENKSIQFECWLPVRFGEMVPYNFSWPSQISITTVYPIPGQEKFVGSASPQKDVKPPTSFYEDFLGGIPVTYQEGDPNSPFRPRWRDYGEYIPSDLDDQKPTPKFVSQNYNSSDLDPGEYQYQEFPFDPPGANNEQTVYVYPCTIISGSGASYECDVYTAGLGKAPVRRTVKQLQIASDSQLPAGSWGLAVLQKVLVGDGDDAELQDQWTMQLPVWL